MAQTDWSTRPRQEKVDEIQRLRAQGLGPTKIAKLMGMTFAAVKHYYYDPDLSKQRARKASYGGTCERCGGPTSGSEGRHKVPTVCFQCLYNPWTRERAVDSVLAFKRRYGRSPRAADVHDGNMPTYMTVKRLFGTWNALLLAAGLELNMDRRPETQAAIEEELRRGDSVAEIAARRGWEPANVYVRMRTRGVTVIDMRPEGFYGSSRRPPKRWSAEDTATFVELWKAKVDSGVIAERFGITRAAAHTRAAFLRQRGYDLPLRWAGRRRFVGEQVA
jgi:hypothetical protein